MCSFAGVMELDDINKYYSLKKFIEENDIVEFEIQKGDWARQIYFIGNMLSDCRYQSLYFSKMKKNQHSDDYWPIIIFDDLLENEKDRPCDPFLKIIDRSNK